jgi:hypothetical protein
MPGGRANVEPSRRSCSDFHVGFETFIRFHPNPLDPRPYAPETFLRDLDTDPSSLACSTGASGRSENGSARVFEYRALGESDGWPAVVVTIEPDGFLVCEYDRSIGTRLFGPLVKYALDRAADARVLVECT